MIAKSANRICADLFWRFVPVSEVFVCFLVLTFFVVIVLFTWLNDYKRLETSPFPTRRSWLASLHTHPRQAAWPDPQ